MTAPKPTEAVAPLKLREATLLGSLVAATSPDSRYVVVLTSARLNLAVRWLGVLAIRVEPFKRDAFTNEEAAALSEMGFSVNTGKLSYASVHWNADGVQAFMTIGAMVAGVASLCKGHNVTVASFDYLLSELRGKGA